jgi:lipoprotein-anchoring transpeptidase ErfK/SrfK
MAKIRCPAGAFVAFLSLERDAHQSLSAVRKSGIAMRSRFFRGILPALILSSVLAGCAAQQQQTSLMSREAIEANAKMANGGGGSFFGMAQIARIPREIVPAPAKAKPGTIIVKTGERRLYLVMEDGKALRYGIGVGRDGFRWSGVEKVSMKKEWPDWTPPAQMLKRRPDLPRHMEGGPENPLGARAMYLGSSFYRIHGSNEEESIGGADSSGCIRMTNTDVIDLYSRVKVGTTVIVQL